MITAVILTHNNEDTLPRTLKSLTWCDEVIIVDDESLDSTGDIAKKMGATVYVHKLNDDFAAQRNFGLAKAKGPARHRLLPKASAGGEWVLFVDSDEVVTPELASEIQKVSNANGFYIKRNDYIFGRWLKYGETGKIKLLRLARKDAGKWIRPVHEIWEIKGDVRELVHPLLHYPHQNVAQFLDEINRYSTLTAKYLYSQKIKEPSWYIVAKPLAKFFSNYFWHLGFLDGTAGAVVAIMMSFHSFLVRGKLWQLWDKS